MFYKDRHGIPPPDDETLWQGTVWDAKQLDDHVRANSGCCLVIVGGFVIDATGYLGEHVCARVIVHSTLLTPFEL